MYQMVQLSFMILYGEYIRYQQSFGFNKDSLKQVKVKPQASTQYKPISMI